MLRFFSILLPLLLTFGCSDRIVVAKIGRYEITKKYTLYRDEVERVYNPGEKRNLGLFQLTKGYRFAEILAANGRGITKETLLKEEERINRTTFAAARLQKIKDIFGADHQAYLDVYVLPVYAEHSIYYDFFLTDSKTQAKSLDHAQRFLREALTSRQRLRALAKKYSYSTGKFTVSLSRGIQWISDQNRSRMLSPEGVQQAPVSGEEAKLRGILGRQGRDADIEAARHWIDEVIKPLKPGSISPRIIDGKENWQIVRFIRPVPMKNNFYEMEAVMIPKDRFDDWLKGEMAKINTWVRSGSSLDLP